MTQPAHTRLQIKGIRDGLLITLAGGEWSEQKSAFLRQINEQQSFFQGARLALDVGSHILRAAELGSLRDQLSERGITLWAVLSSSPTTEQTAQALGIATRIAAPRAERSVKPLDTNLNGEGAVLVHRTLRSGYRLAHQGHVVVIGDVNPGAEIIAQGSVVVWGRLRGVVHAGSEGDDSAVVCALDLEPTQLRIGDQVAVPPKRRGKPQPEIVRLVNGQIVAEPWNQNSKR